MDSAAAPEDDDALAATQEEDGGETDDESASWGKLLSADGSVSLDCEEAEHSVGRAPTCSLVLASQRVSALHARLRRGTPPTVEDCSTNGVWHNGARIGKGNLVGLHDKDTLAFGCAPGGGGEPVSARYLSVCLRKLVPLAEAIGKVSEDLKMSIGAL